MANKTYQIKIESILGGISPMAFFANPTQYRSAIAINPALPIDDFQSVDKPATGLLRPSGSVAYGGASLNGTPLWIKGNPKDNILYVYDNVGSTYSVSSSTISGLGDLNDGGTAGGNGMAYYDNYMYFARDTTVARYGPLNGTPAFTDDYWVGTLGLTQLSDTQYPVTYSPAGIEYPNHLLHRHSDGRLYILDVVDNQGTIHYIQTSKTTVEGDTNNGSTYNKVQVGYGLWPTAVESYGSSLVFAFYEGTIASGSSGDRKGNAKVAFWDTVSDKINQLSWVEYPDDFISSIKNVNGILYFTSGNNRNKGFRVTAYVGGNTFKEVAFFEQGQVPFNGAVDGNAERLVFGTATTFPTQAGVVYSYGLKKAGLGSGLHCIAIAPDAADSLVTAVSLTGGNLLYDNFTIGWDDNNFPADSGIGLAGGSTYSSSYPSVWESQFYRIGRPFKITKIRIPLAQPLAANMVVTPRIYRDGDNFASSFGLTEISTTNYSLSTKNIVQRPKNLTGDYGFYLNLTWTGSALCVIGLPITIEYELIDD